MHWCNHCCSGKAIRITYSECVCVAIGVQHAMHMHHIVVCVWPAPWYFSMLSLKWHNLKKKKLLNIKCVFVFVTTSVRNVCHYNKNWLKIYIGLYVTYLLFSSDFNETWIFLIDFWKMLKYQILWKSFQWELSCFHVDKQTWQSWLLLFETMHTLLQVNLTYRKYIMYGSSVD